MINLGVKTKQRLLGMATGFFLAMFFPTDLAWSQSNKEAVASNTLERWQWWRIILRQSSLSLLIGAMLVSASGIVISLICFGLNPPLSNSILLLTVAFSSATLVASFLTSFFSKE